MTICTQGRTCLFSDVVDGEMWLNVLGKIVREEWQGSAHIRHEIHMDTFVVMPNHVHGIVMFTNGDTPTVGATGRSPLHETAKPGPRNRSLGTFIAGFKSAVTKRINQRRAAPGASVWQRNYYKHIVRNQDELDHIREYIAENPLKWEFDRENPAADGELPQRKNEPWGT